MQHIDISLNTLNERLEALQRGFVRQFENAFPDPLAPKTVVIVPSLSLDPEILLKIKGNIYYEERLLCMLMLLRMPRTRVVYVSSIPIAEETIDYYLHLLPGITAHHARERLVLLSCYDASNVPLTQKILSRPRLLERIRQAIPSGHVAHLASFTITKIEEELAVRLGIPVFGCPSRLEYWGTKSGSRLIFKKAGVPLPEGFEDLKNMTEIAAALTELKKAKPALRKAVVKLNDGFSGDGNAIFSYDKDQTIDEEILQKRLRFVAEDMDYPTFAGKMTLMEGIVEEFLEGKEKTSPSVQCRINPLNQIDVISTHDQILGGESEQVYVGATFPANSAYNREIGEMGYRISEELVKVGALGRFGIDFISAKNNGNWNHYAVEINLRKGGTTHPFLMLQFLTDGEYDYKEGIFRMPNGQSRCYFATDGLVNEKYQRLTPPDLIDLAICNGIHYDATIQEGVTFHLIGTLSEYGKLGMVCIARDMDRAFQLYKKTVEMLDVGTEEP